MQLSLLRHLVFAEQDDGTGGVQTAPARPSRHLDILPCRHSTESEPARPTRHLDILPCRHSTESEPARPPRHLDILPCRQSTESEPVNTAHNGVRPS